MKEGWTYYNDDKTLKGIEFRTQREGDTLYVWIGGSNSIYDYIRNMFAWPRKKIGEAKVHRYWYRLASKMISLIDFNGVKNLRVAGHSMGGAVGEIFCWLTKDIDFICRSINAPKSGIPLDIPYYYRFAHRGDIVGFLPLFYKKVDYTFYYGVKKTFTEAHVSMPTYLTWWNDFI